MSVYPPDGRTPNWENFGETRAVHCGGKGGVGLEVGGGEGGLEVGGRMFWEVGREGGGWTGGGLKVGEGGILLCGSRWVQSENSGQQAADFRHKDDRKCQLAGDQDALSKH